MEIINIEFIEHIISEDENNNADKFNVITNRNGIINNFELIVNVYKHCIEHYRGIFYNAIRDQVEYKTPILKYIGDNWIENLEEAFEMYAKLISPNNYINIINAF